MAEKTLIQKALDIIEHTNDGDDLSPPHLKLTEMAVNGFLSENGIKLFDELYKQVMTGAYTKPYLQGVEFMTQDHEGYIYFKDQHVEHYSRPWAYSMEARDCLEDLQKRCLFLERNQIEISFGNAVCMPEALAERYHEEIVTQLNELTKENAVIFSYIKSDNDNARQCSYWISGMPDADEVWDNSYAKDFIENNSDKNICNGIFNAKVETYTYGSGKQRNASPEELQQIRLCFDYLKEKQLIDSIGTEEYRMNINPEIEEDDNEEMDM